MSDLVAACECLLFVAGEPLADAEVASALHCERDDVQCLMEELSKALDARGSGLHVLRIAGGYQLATRQAHAAVLARYFARSASRLSRAALETAAIVAYQQPVTLPEIEAIRGVSTSGVVKTLLDRRLLAEVGRKRAAGRPILYGTTPEFLHYFGLADIDDLPSLPEPEQPSQIDHAGAPAAMPNEATGDRAVEES
ncbi:MAG TPA: SMC-Scp complex subunit ScpB [Chthonomonadales bacterium]|nr:SMC-Scp complex subunit ScpB [Chthonomonadales bacterium]